MNIPAPEERVPQRATFPATAALLDRIDPRLRVVAAVAFSVLVAVVNRYPALATALACSVLFGLSSGQSLQRLARRMLPVNTFLLLLVLILPWSTSGTALVEVGPVRYTLEGVRFATIIVLKANAIVLALVSLLGAVDMVTLGHALAHLHVPKKLTHLLLFTVRYFDVLHREYLRLRWAMKARAFRPRISSHTYRTFGHLVGMLLVRSLERSDRIVAAMKCRGFCGQFYLLDHFAYTWIDACFALTFTVLLVAIGLVEWI